ncbi:MAG TPA: PDZ domain-containing protein, partial [Leptolyngbya sp.]|nr:PDZ domain-containing protein [Leptolyngbya sp.]
MTQFSSRSLSKLIPAGASFSLIALIAPGTVPAQISFQDSPKAVLDQAWQIVAQTYVDPQFNHVNWQQTRQTLLSKSYSDRTAAYDALKTALKQLNDPYTRFLDPKAFQALNSQDIDGELTGVGLQLENKGQSLQVVKPIEGSPALKAGLQVDDKILAIDGKSTKGMTVEAASQLIRGRENTTVTLLIDRANRSPFKV